jgi:legumain
MGKNKKTLKSNFNSDVFIYFADHGATGVVTFPEGQLLHAKEIITTLKYMKKKRKFKNLVFYLGLIFFLIYIFNFLIF